VVQAGRPEAAPDERGDKHKEWPQDIAMLAHELRRRMAAMRVIGEAITMLRGQRLDTAAMLDLLAHEINDLDDLARAVLGDRHDRPNTLHDADVVATARAAARTVAAARGAVVRVDADGAVHVPVSATPLRQAIENLIDNAAIHGGPDEVEVAVHVDPAAGQVEVVVADRGTPQGPSDGHGMGLLLVRQFLDDVDGRSWVERRQGGGTVVGLSLPLRPPATADQPGRLDRAVST
jgi:two-component system, OmpR family, osmolarity sensor histidine kinase EnvZ